MEEIDLKDYLLYLKDKILFILITIILLLGTIFIYDKFIKVPMYKTYTTIALVKSNQESSYTQTDLNVNKSFVTTYSVIVKGKNVLNKTIDDLNLNYSIDKLAKRITVSSPDDSQLIKIAVTDESPIMAYKIAKTVAKEFSNEVMQTWDMNNIRVSEDPEISNSISNNTLYRDLLLGIIGGLVLSCGVLFIIYYFDDTIKYNENIEEELGLPVLAKVFKSRVEDVAKKKGKKNTKMSELILAKYPKSVVSESIKTLRTNLEFTSVEKNIKTMLVTSSIPGEGKSFISSNLGISFAQSNKKVLLIDCDMRKGRLHKIFKLSNTKGYSNLLIDDIENYKDYIQKTNIDGVSVITRGTIPPNPSELLNSSKNKELIKELKKHYDKIIFDGVPCSGLPDSIIMSSLVDKVLIVSSNKYTPKNEFLSTKNMLKKANAPIAGFIVNKIDSKQGAYGKYYYYYGDNK